MLIHQFVPYVLQLYTMCITIYGFIDSYKSNQNLTVVLLYKLKIFLKDLHGN